MTQSKEANHHRPIIFEDVIIRLWRANGWEDTKEGQVFQAHIRQTPIPLQNESFRVNSLQQLEELQEILIERTDLNQFFYDYTTPPKRSDQGIEQIAHDLAELGDKFYDLLPVSIRDELPRLIQEVFEQGHGIRLILEVKAGEQSDRLLSLPWELLFFKETRVYPARSSRLLIVRRLLHTAYSRPINMTAPFKLVHVIADDPEHPIEADLQQMERQVIHQTMGPEGYIRIEKPGSQQKWLDAQLTHKTQILHFLGCGKAPEQKEEEFAMRGHLRFVNHEDQPQWVTGEQLQQFVNEAPELQIVVLNLRDNASTNQIALDLVYSGFPYVVVMPNLAKEPAKQFVHAFYSHLQQGYRIEEAVAAGRFEIAAQLPGAIDWCLPRLYSNGDSKSPAQPKPTSKEVTTWVKEHLQPLTLVLGVLHLAVGVLLLISDVTFSLPDTPFMLLAIGWLVAAPPFLAGLLSKQLQTLPHWNSLTHLTFFARLLGTAMFSVGLFLLYTIWFSLVLFVALGFWDLLSPLGQNLLLILLLIIAIWASYTLTRHDGSQFITQIQATQQISRTEQVKPLLGGGGMLLIAYTLIYFSANLFMPPLGNLIIGTLLLSIYYVLRHWTQSKEDQTKEASNTQSHKTQKKGYPDDFDDVIIRLTQLTDESQENKFQANAEVRHTPIPLQGGAFQIDRDEQLEAFLQLFTGQVNLNHFFYDYTTPPHESDPQLELTASGLAELSDKLHELLPVSIHNDLPHLIQKVSHRGRGIRLIIEASASNQANRLLSLPWELLFFNSELYRTPRLLVVRRLLDAVRHSPIEMAAPFDLLHVIADDPNQPICINLQQMEYDTILNAIEPGHHTLVEDPGSIQKLLNALQTNRAQILHFLGHGEANNLQQENASFTARGYLCFINKAGEREWVTGEQLRNLLSGTAGLQLIVLNACDSALVVTSNIALDLVYSGFPYVVAMQAEMPQEAAKHFIRAFYGHLQEGQSIEEAVAAGRVEIATQLPGAIDWCLPVLYTNVGVQKKSLFARVADQLTHSIFRKPKSLPRAATTHLIVGGLHLAVGLLLLLSGSSPPLPNIRFIAWTIYWMFSVSLLFTVWGLWSRPFEIPISQSYSIRIAWVVSGLVFPTVNISLLMFEFFSLLILLAGLGFWALLSPLAQRLLLLPFFFISILFGYMQVRFEEQRLSTWARLGPPPLDLISVVVALLLGYIILLTPLGVLYFELGPDIPLTQPQGNLLIGALYLLLGYVIHQENKSEWGERV